MGKAVRGTLFMFWILTIPAYGQQDAQFSQYMFNTLYLNPAFAGSEGVTRFQLIHRSQWTAYQPTFDDGSAPTTQNFSLTAPILRLKSGVGVHIVNDRLGPLQNLEAQVAYAYHLPLKKGKLSLGIRTGIYSQVINANVYRAINEDDKVIQTLKGEGRQTQIRPDAALGIYYRTEKYYAGVSVNHLVKSEFDFGVPTLRNPLNNNVSITGGYNLDLNYQFVLTPSFLVKTDLNTYSFELSSLVTYDQRMWGGLSFRQGDAATIILGISMLKDKDKNYPLRLSYAFDYIIKGQAAKKPTSNEILVSYTLPAPRPNSKSITRTPRFRH